MEMRTLPDVASPSTEKPLAQQTLYSALQWVGMNRIQIPVRHQQHILSAKVTALVNLKSGHARGIHMSRIYNLLSSDLAHQSLTNRGLVDLAQKMVESQKGLSTQARLEIEFDLPLDRNSLRSEMAGHRIYPVKIRVETTEQGPTLSNEFEILYSSTCPASMALSLEVWKESFLNGSDQPPTAEAFQSWLRDLKKMPAAPHAQRSLARLQVNLKPESNWTLESLIDQAEIRLKTPVQSFVKRIDEQEFARLNGQNPMFCEDAARVIQSWLDQASDVLGYQATFEHQESLHPHNAFAQIQKNIN